MWDKGWDSIFGSVKQVQMAGSVGACALYTSIKMNDFPTAPLSLGIFLSMLKIYTSDGMWYLIACLLLQPVRKKAHWKFEIHLL